MVTANTVGRKPRPKKPLSPNTHLATVPAANGGRLMPPVKPGEVRNPTGRPRSLKEVRLLCRKESLDAVHALISTYKTPEGLIDRMADPKVIAVVVPTLLKWGFGEPPAYDPHTDKPPMTVDLSGLSLDDRRNMLKMMQRLSVAKPDANSPEDNGPDFDPSRFAPLPTVIEEKEEEEPKPEPVRGRQTGQSPTKAAPVAQKSAPIIDAEPETDNQPLTAIWD